MEVSMVACEGYSDDDTLTRETTQQNALKAFSTLNEKQRPGPSTFSTKEHFIKHYGDSKKKVRWGFAVDFAEHVPCFVSLEKQYLLNTKQWLAECPLKSANDRIIDPAGDCSMHQIESGLWYVEPECDACKHAVEKQTAQLRDKLTEESLPFVLKITQALGSVGMWLVRNEEDRKKTIDHITKIYANSLPHFIVGNPHNCPATLIISDMLPGDTNALNIFLRLDGSIRFLGACQQLSTRIADGGCQYTALRWEQQETLEAKFGDTLTKIGKNLHNEGYFGSCGADVMENDNGVQYVTDLNVRTTTSTILGCLKTH